MIRSYKLADLVAIPIFPFHGRGGHYRWEKFTSFDEATGRLEVETEHWKKYTFDVTTGGIVEGTTVWTLPILHVLPIVMLVSVFSLWRRRQVGSNQ